MQAGAPAKGAVRMCTETSCPAHEGGGPNMLHQRFRASGGERRGVDVVEPGPVRHDSIAIGAPGNPLSCQRGGRWFRAVRKAFPGLGSSHLHSAHLRSSSVPPLLPFYPWCPRQSKLPAAALRSRVAHDRAEEDCGVRRDEYGVLSTQYSVLSERSRTQ